MANVDQVRLPDGSQYNLQDTTSNYATQAYVQQQVATVNKNTIGLGNVDNTHDIDKPVSTAQQTAIDAKVNNSVIATPQSNTTAVTRYEIGEQFLLNGYLYVATAIIPNGSEIIIGTNCELANKITDQINDVVSDVATLDTAVGTKSAKTDLTNLDLTGTTNTTGSTIASGTYFYLDGVLVRAKTNIASGATFTLNTNYETVPKGVLNNKRVGTVTLTGLANGINNIDITFDSALPSIPFVCVTLKNASDNNHIRKDCYCWVSNISKTGFRLNLFNGGSSNVICEYDYLAIV